MLRFISREINEPSRNKSRPKEAALKALYGATYAYRDLGPRTYNSDTQTVKVVGAATMSNTRPQSVYINTNGPFRNTTLLVVTPSGVKTMTVDFDMRLRGAEFGSLLLLHELGHLTGSLSLMPETTN